MAKHDNVHALVTAFSAELEELIRAEIRRGFETVLGTPSPAPKRGRKPAAPAAPPVKVAAKFASGGRKKGEKRTPEQLLAVKEALRSYIAKNPGQGIEAIGRALSIPTKDLARPAKQLLEAKAIKSTGQKRATKYFPAR